MILSRFFRRYTSFILAKFALLIGRTAILIMAFRWLSTEEFSLVAAGLSVVEIVRSLSDLGVESIIYARLSSSNTPLTRVVKQLIRLRIFAASALSLVGFTVFSFFVSRHIALLFVLPLATAIQNSSFAFMQKVCAFKKISDLVLFAGLISILSIWVAYLQNVKGLALIVLIILPEVLSCLLAMFISRSYWKETYLSGICNFKFISKLFPFILPSMGVNFFAMLYSRLDVLLVFPILGTLIQSNYSAGFRFVEPFFLIFSFLSISLLAELGSYDNKKTIQHIKDIRNRMNLFTYLLLFLFGVILALILAFIAKRLFFYPTYVCWLIFFIALGLPIKIINTLLTSFLQRGGKFNMVFYATAQTLVLTFLFGFVLIYFMGIWGVVLASIFAEVANFHRQKASVDKMLTSLVYKYS